MSVSQVIDWGRVYTSISQELAQTGQSAADVDQIMKILPDLVELCGSASQTRAAAGRIGRLLARTRCAPEIVAPSCPDYEHRDGLYTCRGIGGGVPMLARLQMSFLDKIVKLVPGSKVTILIADQEGDDPKIAAACGISPAEFRFLIKSSVAATQKAVADRGWAADMMTEYFPNLRRDSQHLADELSADESKRLRFDIEIVQRSRLLNLIDPLASTEERLARTINTAAQYAAISRYAREADLLISNHTTTNLSWYASSGVAVLHNPHKIY